MQKTERERPFIISKEILDTVNSVSWFFADAFWMLDYLNIGVGLMIPTIVSGLCLLYVEKRHSLLFINIAINCWIWMNTLWMASDMDLEGGYLLAAKVFFILGAICILLAALTSKNLKETFSHFKRFRFKQ